MKTRRHSKTHGGGLFSPGVNEYGNVEPSWVDNMKNKIRGSLFSSGVNEYGQVEPSWLDKMKNKISGYQSYIPAMKGGKSVRKGLRKIKGSKLKRSRKNKKTKRTRKNKNH